MIDMIARPTPDLVDKSGTVLPALLCDTPIYHLFVWEDAQHFYW
jgi:hypothetical protein